MIARAMFCRSTVLPVRGGATINARWPLPSGETISITRADLSLIVGSSVSSLSFSSGIERSQVVEIDAVPDLVSGSSKLIVVTRVSAK